MAKATNQREREGRYWLAPIDLIEKIPEMPGEFLLLLLLLYYHVWRANDRGVRVSIGQLAAEAGLSQEKTAAALRSLRRQGVIQQTGDQIGLDPDGGASKIAFPPLPEA